MSVGERELSVSVASCQLDRGDSGFRPYQIDSPYRSRPTPEVRNADRSNADRTKGRKIEDDNEHEHEHDWKSP